MRILIDGQSLQTDSRIRGIGRYAEGLIEGLAKTGSEVVVLFNGIDSKYIEAVKRLAEIVPEAKTEVFYAIGDCSSLNVNGLDYFLSTKLYQDAVNRINPDVFLCPSMFEIGQNFVCPPVERISKFYPVAIVNHDLIPFENFDRYLPDREYREAYFSILRTFLSGELFLCNSKFTERQLQKYFPGSQTAVVWGASFTVELENVHKGEYIFYCGGLDERKNVDFLCRAYAKLPYSLRSKYPLYICCRKNSSPAKELIKRVNRLNVGQQIQFVEAETNEELARLYAECKVFIFPSKLEGLGLPLIEALTFQAPVLTSHAASLPEIIDNPDALFSPYDEQQLTTKLQKVLTDPLALKQLQDYSDLNKTKFTWKKVGERTLEFLEQLISKRLKSRTATDSDLSAMVLPLELRKSYNLAQVRQVKRTIYFDVSVYWCTKAHTGIQRVVNKFMQYLPKELSDYNFDIAYIVCKDGTYWVAEYRDEKWKILTRANPVANDWYMSVDLCGNEILDREHDLIEWKKRGVKIFVYVHDIIFEKSPEYIINQETVSILKKWLRVVACNSDCVMSNSNSVIEDFKKWANSESIDLSSMHFLPQHLGSDIFIDNSDYLPKDTNTFQFICVSTIEPRKGYVTLLKSFIEALNNGMNAKLVVVGRPGWKANEEIQLLEENPYANTKIVWENDCSDDRLQKLYKQSDCFVFASYDEGFGLGIVEAARYGLPLLLRDIPIFRELAGKHALYFNDETLACRLADVASGKLELPSVKGMEVLTWKESVHKTAQRLIELSRNEFFSYLKNPDENTFVEPISELFAVDQSSTRKTENPPVKQVCDQLAVVRKFSTCQRIKFRILSKIWPSSERRRYYQDKADGIVRASLGSRHLSLIKRLKYSFGSCCAPTEEKRRHYADKLRRGI